MPLRSPASFDMLRVASAEGREMQDLPLPRLDTSRIPLRIHQARWCICGSLGDPSLPTSPSIYLCPTIIYQACACELRAGRFRIVSLRVSFLFAAPLYAQLPCAVLSTFWPLSIWPPHARLLQCPFVFLILCTQLQDLTLLILSLHRYAPTRS